MTDLNKILDYYISQNKSRLSRFFPC